MTNSDKTAVLIITAAVIASVALAITEVVLIMTQPTPYYRSLPPCAYEDSDNCFWDAELRGNGEGQSFYTLNGTTTVIGGK